MLPPTNLSAVSESDLSTIVSTIIISCPQSINKLVKKEVLDKLGLPVSPGIRFVFCCASSLITLKNPFLNMTDRRVGRKKTIATFFSKRCLPPDDKNLSAHGNQSQKNSDSSS
ncbi:hypothetical protein SAY86_028334 [Trapa natans]|uniref:Uncharacterized protein n=1 Tax=Trapa natans TaxID=22666 RepID=A0AAN7RGB0_TRANT|nr:hypothetical protein SAY86_028334 [Trapa natans]